MGLEYIVQPQVFLGGLTALGPGIQGLTEQYPLLTTYYSWTSTASVNTSVFPIPLAVGSIYNGPGKEASFIISVGGVIQSPTEYTVDSILRTITFSSVVSAGIEFAATQLATAAPSSQNFNFLKSVSAEFTLLTATDGTIQNLFVTNLTALSTTVDVINIQYTELSGFDVTGDVNVFGNVNVTDSLNLTGNLVAGDVTSTNATFTNLTATDLTTSNLIVSNPVNSLNVTDITVTDLTATNSTITNLQVTNLTANNITVNGDVSASGAIKAVNTWPNRQSNILVNDGAQFNANIPFEVYSVLPTIEPNNIYEASFYVTMSARTANPNIAFQLSGSAPFTILGGQAWGDTYTTAGGQPYTIVDLEATYGSSGPSTEFLLLPPATYNSPINTVNGFNITTILSSDSTLQLQISGITNQISRVKGRTLYNINLLQSV